MNFILRFKELTLKDKPIFEAYSKFINTKSYEYTYQSLYLWRKLCDTKYTVLDEALIINKNEEFKGSFFMQPIGYKNENLEKIIKELIEIRKYYPTNYLFGDVNKQFIDDIKKYTSFKVIGKSDLNDAEYIYATQQLINLNGKKYHNKKNHYNKFINTYNYRTTEINSEKIKSDCLLLLKRWHSVKKAIDKELTMEIDAINDVLNNLKRLNLRTIAVYVENDIAGFSVGEKYADDMANILIEKADAKYNGIYAFINREFLSKQFTDTKYVNRQEDCGVEGLRKSKKSYNPIRMEEKFLINLY